MRLKGKTVVKQTHPLSIVFGKASKDEARTIAELHKTNIPSGFLSTLDTTFLEILYETFISSRCTFCLVARNGEAPVGFIACSLNTMHSYREFITKHWHRAMALAWKKCVNPQTMRRIVETLRYPWKTDDGLPKSELLSIAVNTEYRRSHVGERLFRNAVQVFNANGISEFKVVVGSNLSNACRFYEQMGARRHATVSIHLNEDSNVYLVKV